MKLVVRSMGNASEMPAAERQAIKAAFAAWHAGQTLSAEQQRLLDGACRQTMVRQFGHYFSAD